MDRKYAYYGGAAVAVLLLLTYCGKKRNTAIEEAIKNAHIISVPPSVVRLVGGHGVPNPSNDSSHSDSPEVPDLQPPYIPPEARIVITPKDPSKTLGDVVNVKVSGTWGPTFEPGIRFSAYPPGAGLDAKIFYIQKWGLELGAEYYFKGDSLFSPIAGVSYRLDYFRLLKNTELTFNYAPLVNRQLSMGVRVNF